MVPDNYEYLEICPEGGLICQKIASSINQGSGAALFIDYGKNLSVQEIDGFINESKDIVLENFAVRPEFNTLVRNHLRQLEKKNVCLECKTTKNKNYCVMEFPEDFYSLLRQVALAKSSECDEAPRELLIHIVQSNKLTEVLKSPNWKPSFEWEETIADEGDEGLLVWHNGEFDIEEVSIDYLKMLPNVYAPSLLADGQEYHNEDGEEVAEDKDLEIDSTFLWRKFVDVALLIAQRDLSDYGEFQTQLNKILHLEKMYVSLG